MRFLRYPGRLRGSAVSLTCGGDVVKMYVALARGEVIERVRLYLWVVNMVWGIKVSGVRVWVRHTTSECSRRLWVE